MTTDRTHVCWHSALLVGCAGGATAQSMVQWGGPLAHHLPPVLPLMAVACVGAGAAGLLCSGAFGRRGWLGQALALVAWPVVTMCGAALAAALYLWAGALFVAGTPAAATQGAGLGILAVTDGIMHSPVVAAVWVASALLVQQAMRAERQSAT